LAQIEHGARDATGDIEERQVTDLAGGVAQTLGHLAAEGEQDVRILLDQFAELGIAQFGHFALGLGTYPGAAWLFRAFLFKQAHLTEEIPGIEIGDDHLAPVIVLDEDGDRALDDEKQRFTTITGIDDRAFRGVATTVAMYEKFVEMLVLGSETTDSDHALNPQYVVRPVERILF